MAEKLAKKGRKEMAKPYEPTPRELRALSAQENRRQRGNPIPALKAAKGGNIAIDHPDAMGTGLNLLKEALGTASDRFSISILGDIGTLGAKGGVDLNEYHLNNALSLVTGVKPQDEVETMLATQMAAIHMATMGFAASLNAATTRERQEFLERSLNKLARTFAAQVETLKRYRSKGEQRVIVERVTVNEGGQAIVGSVNPRGE